MQSDLVTCLNLTTNKRFETYFMGEHILYPTTRTPNGVRHGTVGVRNDVPEMFDRSGDP